MDSIGCIATATHPFTVISFTIHAPNDTDVCLKDSMLIIPTMDAPSFFNSFIYQWSPGNNIGNIDSIKTSFFSQNDQNYTYIITASATAPYTCTSSDTVTIHAHTPVILHELSNDSTITYGSSIRLHVKGAYYYYWQPQGYIDNPNMEDPIVHPTEPTIFTVIGYNQFGCNDSAHVKVDLSYPDHFVPSAFSPNGDGKNDVFHIIHVKYHKLLEFRVFNRWGQEVFNTQDPNNGWDGTCNGQLCDIGTYHYLIRVVTADGKELTDVGDITLVR
jgi:gliding motility-associated-like protein